MSSIRKLALACMTAAMVSVSVNAEAQSPRNQDTFFTFSQAVELPKATLPAGTYFFQLMDSGSNRHIVKVMSQDRKQLHATLMAIPFYSTDRPSDDPQVRFMETPAAPGAAATNAIKIWFYPGNSVGHEFIYPREQAMHLAVPPSDSVLTTKTDGGGFGTEPRYWRRHRPAVPITRHRLQPNAGRLSLRSSANQSAPLLAATPRVPRKRGAPTPRRRAPRRRRAARRDPRTCRATGGRTAPRVTEHRRRPATARADRTRLAGRQPPDAPARVSNSRETGMINGGRR